MVDKRVPLRTRIEITRKYASASSGAGKAQKFRVLETVADMHTGWVYTHAIKNNAAVHIATECTQIVERVPYLVTGLDFDLKSEFINHDFIDGEAERKTSFTPAKAPAGYSTDTVRRPNECMTSRRAHSHV